MAQRFGCGTFFGVGQSSTSTANSFRRLGNDVDDRRGAIDALHTGALSATAHIDSSLSMPRQHCVVEHVRELFRRNPDVTTAGFGEHQQWQGLDLHASAVERGRAPVNSYRVNISNERSSSSVPHRCTLNQLHHLRARGPSRVLGHRQSHNRFGIRHRLTRSS